MESAGVTVRLRKKFLPRSFADFNAFVFVALAIPLVYWFEVYIVMPTVFGWNLYIFHIFLGTFVVINIFGNFLAIMLIDTSTNGLMLPSQVPNGWHICADCESVAPPRSRHCNTCKICILKKEHHCVFTGCCVGLFNHRYFFVFLMYMWVSTLYCSSVNAFFVWPYVGGFNWWAAVRLLLPGVWLLLDPSRDTLYAFLVSIVLIGFLFMSVLVYYYTNLLFNNVTTQENGTKFAGKFDLGRKNNIKVTLGENWYLTWVFPLLPSVLPFDGLEWTKGMRVKKKKSN